MKKELILGSLLTFASLAKAQNSSYNANTIPITGSQNCAFGSSALVANTTGADNVAVGYQALTQNMTGVGNSGVGYMALSGIINGNYNAAFGFLSLQNNFGGSFNTGMGNQALNGNNADSNTAVGFQSIYTNWNGSGNTATGYHSLFQDINGNRNTAFGHNSQKNSFADDNSSLGYQSLYHNSTGKYNTAIGEMALVANTTADSNVAVGHRALFQNTTGKGNVAVGVGALSINATGQDNIALGNMATLGANNLNNAGAIGAYAISTVSHRIYIGDATTNVWCQTGIWNTSDQQFKTSINADDVKGLEFIKLLRPVVYNFDTKKLTAFQVKNLPGDVQKQYLDRDFSAPNAVRQSGFLAQEVEQAAKQTGYNFSGVHSPENDNDTYGLSYAQFVVPLVKAVQEMDAQNTVQNTKIDSLAKLNSSLQSQLTVLQNQLNTLLNGSVNSPAGAATGINQAGNIPNTGGFSLDQNIPNPFGQETVIKYNLPASISNASMVVYDLSGKQITSFPLTQRGASSITLTSEKLDAGIYIYSVIADGKIMDSKRMVVAQK